MKLRIGFSTTNSWYSRVIRRFLRSETSHCYIRLYDDFLDAELIFHADMPGVIIVRGEDFNVQNIVLEEFEIDDIKLNKSIKGNLRHLGKPYDYWEIFDWALFLRFKRWFKRKVKNPLQDPKKMICVDFVLRILNDAEIINLPVGLLNPQTFRDWCMENYEKLGWKRNIFYKSSIMVDNTRDVQTKDDWNNST